MTTIILLSFGGAILSAIIGTFWYSQSTPMGSIHMRYLGFDKLSKEEQDQKIAEAKPKMPKIYAAQLVLSLFTSFATVFITIMSIKNGIPFSAAIWFILLNWLCFMVPVQGANILWGTCDPKIAWKKFYSDIGANLVTVLIIAYIASLFA